MLHSHYQGINIGQGVRSLPGWKLAVYLYLIDGLLIDCGPAIMKGRITKFLRDKHLEQVALTHIHEDHAGMAAWLQQQMKVPIYLHEKSIPDARQKGQYRLYRRITWGQRPAFDPQPMPSRLVTDKYDFEVIDSPGHMRYHNVFYEKNQGWLFSGDLFLSPKPLGANYDDNMQEAIATLQEILTRDFTTLFCAHCGVVHDGSAMLQKKLDYLLELQDKVNTLRQQGLDNHAIDKRLNPRQPSVTRFSHGEWSSYHMINTL